MVFPPVLQNEMIPAPNSGGLADSPARVLEIALPPEEGQSAVMTVDGLRRPVSLLPALGMMSPARCPGPEGDWRYGVVWIKARGQRRWIPHPAQLSLLEAAPPGQATPTGPDPLILSLSQDPGPSKDLAPVDFANQILGVQLWDKQREVLAALPQHRRVAVKSGNGLGKGFCAAAAVLWFLYSHDPAVALSTAPTFRQVRHVLWRQIRRLYYASRQPLGGKILDTRWDLAAERYALGLSADTADQFQGFHSPNLLVVVDEAAGVEDQIFEAIDSVLTSSETGRLLLIGNPTTDSGGFRNAFYQERSIYHTITISALDSPNVQAGEIVLPGLTTAEWVEERRQVWGETSALFRARVLGEFPEQADDVLIGLSDIEASARKHSAIDVTPADKLARLGSQPPEPVIMAVDVARFGSDHSVILVRRGPRVEEIRAFQGLDTMTLTGRVVNALREYHPDLVLVDEIGVGSGVLDRLKELGHPARGVNVARPARHKETYANLRAEGYFRLRELFTLGHVLIPNDNRLIAELSSLRYDVRSDGRVVMESKEAMKKRGLPSPDRADALMMAFLESGPRARLWT